MASRLVTTSFAIVSTAALLAGCDTMSNWFGGHKSSESSGSSGTSYSSSTGSGAPAQTSYNQGAYNQPTYTQGNNTAANSYASGGYDSSATTNSRMSYHHAGERVSSDKVRHAQQALKDQGLYQGSIDGIVGPQTRDAVSQYQRDHNLKQTAMLDRQTLRSLDSSVNSSGNSDTSTRQQ